MRVLWKRWIGSDWSSGVMSGMRSESKVSGSQIVRSAETAG